MIESPVPVFTIKLYRSLESQAACRLLIAPRLEIEKKPNGAICLHVLDEAGVELACYKIGSEHEFAWAVIENPSGRTTEVVRPKLTMRNLGA